MMRAARNIAALSVVLAAALCLTAGASADTPIVSYSNLPSTAQAGGHPDVEIYFEVANRALQHSRSACNCEDAKNATVRLPPGFIGNPHATPQCTFAEFSADTCPIDSQVGIANVVAFEPFDTAIYNLVPPPSDAGLLGFKLYGSDSPQFTVLSSRTGGDYGLNAEASSLYHGIYPLRSLREELWGVPADPSHDPLRLDPAKNLGPNLGFTFYLGELCDENGLRSTADPATIVKPCGFETARNNSPAVSESPLTPFLQNPTNCGSASSSSLEVLSYDEGITSAESPWPQTVGCTQLSFNPSLFAQPTTTATDSASGIEVNLSVPQELSPEAPSPSELRDATVTLPPGLSINPGAADGKTACTDAEALIGPFASEAEAHCPEDSKVGSLTIDSSALPGPLPGYVYLGQPQPGNRYRIFLIANGFGTHVKLAGTVSPDPLDGRLTISFTELPQTPLTTFAMHFFGSERGLLATPTQCGEYPVTSTFTPWDSSLSEQVSTQYFTLQSGPAGSSCPGAGRPFNPGFTAASAGDTAAAHTPFSLQLTRNDGDQNLTGLSVTTPPGLLATLKGIPYCSDAALAAAAQPAYTGRQQEASPSCPAASQIGTATAGAGAGTHPVYLPGKVYLAGPYRGAPLSLAVITPAISGPYDLGNVVLRAALHLNPESAQITAVSDTLPLIHEGIPLRLRSVRIELGRPGFTLNPTNCDPLSVSAQITGDQGAQANLSHPFQVANCASLGFAPKLAMRFSGSTVRAGNPSLHTVLTYPQGGAYANTARAIVTLPPTEIVDNAHINDPCTRVVFAQGSTPGEKCPPGSVIGFAKAGTPLLDKPLEGPVYLRSSGRKLPDIVAALNGQIDITLDGRIDTIHKNAIRTSFETPPDAPVSSFALTLDGGNKGLLQNNTNLCSHTLHATADITGQNGKTANQDPVLATSCGKKHKRKARAHHHRRASR